MSPEPKRRRPGRPKAPTLEQDFFVSAKEHAAQSSVLRFPCTTYANDIIGFAQHVLGFTPCRTLAELIAIRDDEERRGVPENEQRPCLWPKQIEILEAIQRGVRVSVASGHKIGKSHTAGIAGLWFYSCFDDAKVIYSSTTYHQVKTILWDEFRRLRYRSAVFIPGDMHEMPASGFISVDFRSARGFTAKEPEAVAGISGRNLLFILDEASGIPDAIFEAVEGNRAGGARIVLFSNPTKTTGTFADSHNAKSTKQIGPSGFNTFQVSSEETPNAQTGRRLIPGLATRDYVDSMKAEWSEESPFYKVRVKGLFVINEDGKPFSLELIQASEDRWLTEPVEGRLHIGLDPAGPGENGDETAWAVRRGQKILEVDAKRGLSEEAHLAKVLELLKKHRLPGDVAGMMPVVAIDREGPIGFEIYQRVRTHFELSREAPILILAVRASEKARRRPDIYDRHRDELWGSLESWMRSGGAIPPKNDKLEKELHSVDWKSDVRNKLKATAKDDLRKLLGRSPDRADACALCVWEPTTYREAADEEPQAAKAAPRLDPYTSVGSSSPDGAFDPYAGMR